MLNVTVGTNTSRNTVPTPEDYTLRQCLEENGVNYSAAQTSLDGCVLQPGDLDKTFAEMGITSTCYLVSVQKTDNALAA